MNVIFINTTLKSNNEFELFSWEHDAEYGFDVFIKFKTNKIFSGECMLHNVTEIHNLYRNPIDNRIAFESDIHGNHIHGTGCTHSIDDIFLVKISISEYKHSDFSEPLDIDVYENIKRHIYIPLSEPDAFKMNSKYKEEVNEIDKLFKYDLFVSNGVLGNPKVERCYQIARGYTNFPSKHYEVYNAFINIVELIK